jgi:hypothetical protein
LLAFIAAWLCFPRNRKGCVAQLGGLKWRRNQFCRGWLITGDTGSGKTSSGINQLAHQVFQNEPKWGGLCIDEKGVYWETLSAMARHYDREHDLIHLQIRRMFKIQWQPPHRFNLTGDRSIPFIHLCQIRRGYGHESRSGRRQGLFQKPGADAHRPCAGIACRIETPVTLLGALNCCFPNRPAEEELEILKISFETHAATPPFGHILNRFLKPAAEQLGGVRETIGNYLQYFLTPEVAEVFCTGKARSIFRRLIKAKSSS